MDLAVRTDRWLVPAPCASGAVATVGRHLWPSRVAVPPRGDLNVSQ
jgi:hypothetical protein